MVDNLKKSYFWNTLGSGFNSFNSLFFLIIVTRINGLTNAGIFTLSFATASMLYIIALYSGRTYQVTEIDNKLGDYTFIYQRLISSGVMLLVALIFGLLSKYVSYKMTIFILLCFFKASEAICDVFHGVLQKNNRLDIVGKSLLIRSLLNIIVFIIIDKLTNNLTYACISLTIVNVLVLLLVDIKYAKEHISTKKVNYQGVLNLYLLGFFTFGFTFIANYLVNAPRYAIDSLMSEDYQTIFGIIVMPASIIMLANQFVVQPIIIVLKEKYLNKDKQSFLKLIYKVIFITFGIGLLAIICAYFLGIPVLNFLYDIKLNEYLFGLLLIIFGATLYTISSVLSNALIIFRKTKMQLAIYGITSIFAFFISYKLVRKLAFNGAVYSYVLTMLVLLILYIIYFIIIVNKENIWEEKNERKN